MLPVAIKPDIFWVGALDYDGRDFHGYSRSPQGTTYNAYVVKDQKTVLFDCVKADMGDIFLHCLEKVTALDRIDYIVCHHLELDHSGFLPRLVEMIKPEKIFCSKAGLKTINGHFNTTGWPIEPVKTGDSISLGRHTVKFMETPMLHWPDSMVSYIPEARLLISNDIFGQNIASPERFSDQIPRGRLEQAAKEYYYNIVLPYSSNVLKTLAQLKDTGWDIDMIAPDHGLILRGADEVARAVSAYQAFAEQKPKPGALIVFDTMWRSTEEMARYIAEGFDRAGVMAHVMSLKANHHSAIMTRLADCGALLAGSPTHNNNVLPLLHNTLSYIKGLRPKNLMGGAFGSYGWSGEGTKILSEMLTAMNIEQPAAPVRCQYVPDRETLTNCANLGHQLGEALLKKCE
jgi:flavorubredoxin